MSMSLNLQQEVWERNWNYDKQKYQWGSRISKEVVKPKITTASTEALLLMAMTMMAVF